MAEATKNQRAVLIAFDGSKHAINAFDWFMRHVYKPGDLVLMAYCQEVGTSIGTLLKDIGKPGTEKSIQKKVDSATENVRQIVGDVMKKYKVQIQYKFLHLPHPAGENLLKAARDNHAVFIISGSRGNNPARETIMGSTSKFLVAHSVIPVFVCKHKDEQKKLK